MQLRFSTANQQQLEMLQRDPVAVRFGLKDVDYFGAKTAYFKAFMAEVPELMTNSRMGRDARLLIWTGLPCAVSSGLWRKVRKRRRTKNAGFAKTILPHS